MDGTSLKTALQHFISVLDPLYTGNVIAKGEQGEIDYTKLPAITVSNTRCRKSKGEHWVCFVFPKPNPCSEYQVEFFCPMGNSLSFYDMDLPAIDFKFKLIENS